MRAFIPHRAGVKAMAVSLACAAVLAASSARAQPVDPEPVIQVFNLQYANANEVLNVLRNLIDAPYAVDERTNSIVVSAYPNQVRQLADLLQHLDTQDAQPKAVVEKPLPQARRLTVRVVWLISGAGDDLPPPPPGLEAVLAEMSEIGVGDLRTAGQVVANTLGTSRFQVTGAPHVVGPTHLSVNAEMRPSSHNGGPQVMEIELQAVEPNYNGEIPRTLADLSTTVETPLGQFVVLGAAPVDNMMSVFVLHISER